MLFSPFACFSERDDNDRTPAIVPQLSPPEQKDQNYDHHYQAQAPTIVMEWRPHIESTAAEKENQYNQ
jgi:hypothetical protein